MYTKYNYVTGLCTNTATVNLNTYTFIPKFTCIINVWYKGPANICDWIQVEGFVSRALVRGWKTHTELDRNHILQPHGLHRWF